MAFAPFDPTGCCLCGQNGDLTGEHKIKASALRREFGSSPMVVGRTGEKGTVFRSAQGPKSKVLHFEAKICGECNNSATQPADLEFDFFNSAVRSLIDGDKDPSAVFTDPRYFVGSKPYLNVFRYFAKLLCCHMAEVGAPRSMELASFARGLSDRNIVSLGIDRDWRYGQMEAEIGSHQYAAHGGLVVYARKKTGSPQGFHSTRTLGPARYVFFVRLNWLGALELRLAHPAFYEWCREKGKDAEANPLSKQDELLLGLSVEGRD